MLGRSAYSPRRSFSNILSALLNPTEPLMSSIDVTPSLVSKALTLAPVSRRTSLICCACSAVIGFPLRPETNIFRRRKSRSCLGQRPTLGRKRWVRSWSASRPRTRSPDCCSSATRRLQYPPRCRTVLLLACRPTKLAGGQIKPRHRYRCPHRYCSCSSCNIDSETH